MLPIEVAGAKVNPAWLNTVLEALELGDLLRQLPAQLSGGEQQRVAVARAVLPRPDVVLADEPTGALDAGTTRDMVGFLRASVDHLEQTVVMVTHDPLAAQHTDRAVILHEGRLVGEVAQPTAHGVLDALAALADTPARPGGRTPSRPHRPAVRPPRQIPLGPVAPAREPGQLSRHARRRTACRDHPELGPPAAPAAGRTGGHGRHRVRRRLGDAHRGGRGHHRARAGRHPAGGRARRAGRPEPARPGSRSELEQQVRDTPGVAAVAPFETGTAAVARPGAAGDGEVWSVVTAADGPLGRFPLVSGALPTGPDQAAISEAAARRTGMQIGDTFTLVGGAGSAENLAVTGVVTARAQALSTVALDPGDGHPAHRRRPQPARRAARLRGDRGRCAGHSGRRAGYRRAGVRCRRGAVRRARQGLRRRAERHLRRARRVRGGRRRGRGHHHVLRVRHRRPASAAQRAAAARGRRHPRSGAAGVAGQRGDDRVVRRCVRAGAGAGPGAAGPVGDPLRPRREPAQPGPVLDGGGGLPGRRRAHHAVGRGRPGRAGERAAARPRPPRPRSPPAGSGTGSSGSARPPRWPRPRSPPAGWPPPRRTSSGP